MSRLLPQGAVLSAIAPSHAFTDAHYQAGRSVAEDHGYTFIEESNLRATHRWFAGTDTHRAASLQHAFARPDTQGVWAVRGGSGMTRLLPLLDVAECVEKPLIGFSDLTPLLDQIARAGGTAIHGPVLHSLARTNPASVDQLFALLQGHATAPLPCEGLVGGRASGPIVGGNLCLLAATCGTPVQLDAQGCILMIEEIGEHPYRVDRMLQQLALAGVMRGVQGVVLGAFTRCGDVDSPELAEVFEEHFGGLDVPVVRGVPVGHGEHNHAWIVRGHATLADDALTLPTAPSPDPCC